MGIVLWHVTMSLDGFIAAPGDEMGWMTRFAGPNPVVSEVVRSIGAVLSGRRAYDAGRKPGLPPKPSLGTICVSGGRPAEAAFQCERRPAGLPPEFRKTYGGAWSGPVFVLTHHAPENEEDSTITFLSTDIRSAVTTGLQAAGGRNLLVLGADVARQCVEANLVDEMLVHVAPMLLGDGVRLFARHNATPVELETMAVWQAGQITNLRFRFLK